MVEIVNKHISELPKLSWKHGKPTVIVMHETANNSDNGGYAGEINFMRNHYQNAFVHAFAGENNVAEVHDTEIGGAWGAGRSMHHYAIHIELVRSKTKAGFLKAYKNWLGACVYYAKKYDIPIQVNTGSNKKGIYTHHYVTKTFGGTTHQDPDAYLARWGVSIGQMENDIKQVAKDQDITVKPSEKPERPVKVHKGSIVDYLKAQGQDPSYSNRKKLANDYGISGYSGTAAQNKKLMELFSNKKPNQPKVKNKGVKSKVAQLRFYNSPSWSKKDVAGHVKKGYGFPEIVDKIKVGKSHQYKVKNSKGKIYYITASSKYVNADFNNNHKKKTAGLPSGILKYGNKGQKVKKLQEALASIYYYPDKSAKDNGVDSVFGSKTKDALQRFQSTHELKEDGIFGAASRKKLKKAIK